jgi:alkylation response protein AidB-like acyl-CoA dehydrogenase
MSVSMHSELLDAVRELGPTIREGAAAAERERMLSGAVVDVMRGAGLFRMLTPRSLGGLEVDPVTFARVMEEVSRYDSAAGWALQTDSGAWWCCRLPDEGAEELYADDPDAILSAAFHPPLEAVPVDGGYRLTGQRPLASNIHEASWLLVTAVAGEAAIGAIVPAGEAEIVDTWHSLGMRGTDSNDVALNDVFVPTSRTFPLVPDFEPGTHYQGPLYRIPAMAEVAIVAAPVFLGIAREAIDELRALAESKTPFGSARVLRERPATQARLARAEGLLRSARALFYDTLEEAWERALANEQATLEQKADALLAAVNAASSSVEAVELVHGLAGTSGVYTRSPLERHFRDVQTIRHQGFVSASRFETVGQVYLGVDAEFGFVYF